MVLALVEHDGGVPAEASLESLTLARGLAAEDGELAAVAFDTDGSGPGEGGGGSSGEGGPADGDGLADDLAAYGVTELDRVTHDRLDRYAPEAWAASVSQLVDELAPEAVVAPGTDRGHEVLAGVAARQSLPLAANCVAVAPGEPGEPYELERQRWGGSLIEHARLDAGTKLLTVPPHEVAAEPTERADVTVRSFAPSLDDSQFRVRVSRVEESDEEGVPLGEARVVVGGGRGVGSAEDYAILEELADLLEGTVGASRAAVNEGWRPHDDQVGLTGTKIAPDLYVACGISGAVQHMVGCKGAKNILAINTDPEAAIIQKAEYAVIGDLHEVVPAITEAVREAE
jgi:electron transfer flavoprotein alpha subunit